MTKSRTSSCRGRDSFSLLFFSLILVLAFTAGSAQAVTFTVDSTYDDDDDSVDGLACYSLTADGCTLRAAIQEANFLAGIDAIMLSEGTYSLSMGELQINSNLTITGAENLSSTLEEGSIIDGGGLDRVFNVLGGTVTIKKVTITGGRLDGNGLGILNNGTLILEDTTISSNTTIDASFVTSGGGIYNNTGSSITLTNVTISGNTASVNGGGIANAGTMQLTNVTIADNVATAGAGGGIYTSGTTTLENTILANNTSALDGNCSGTLTSNGYNISSDNSCAADLLGQGDWNNTDPLLDALADNGGPTYTHALGEFSPAIDTGDCVDAPATDQRGILRPQDGDSNGTFVCDIGAYEAGILVLTPNGGELLEGGTEYTIEWTAPAGAVYFTIEYSLKGGSKWKRLAKKVAGSSYSWTTPFPKKESYPECFIKIYAYNTYGVRIGYDVSDASFSIKSADITAPAGGETVIPGGLGDPLRIEWDVYNTENPVVTATLFYSTSACGAKPTWNKITDLPGGMRSYNWTIPSTIIEDVPCARVRVLLRDYQGKQLTADTSETFIIDVPVP